MSSVQVVLRKKPNKKKKLPIVIRVTHNRKSTYTSIGQYIDVKYWDFEKSQVKKSHPNSQRLNILILKKLYEVNDKVLKVKTEKDKLSMSKIKKGLSPEVEHDFFEVAEMHFKSLIDRKQFLQSQTEKNRIDLFKKFIKKSELAFEEITVSLLKDFQSYLLYQKKLMPRTVINYLIIIRTIYNRAIAESFTDRKSYPFGKGKIQIKFPETKKEGLNIEEIKLLENAKDITPAQQHALNVWLLSFYFAGIRVGDVLQLRWSDFRDNRLYYRMNKNQKLVSLKIPEKAQKILDIYKTYASDENDLVFIELRGVDFDDIKELRSRTKSVNRNFNRRLEIVAENLGIEKKLTMHIARHSFGNISGDTIPIQMLQKLYRHSSITTTINYQANFIQKDADDALDKVINF